MATKSLVKQQSGGELATVFDRFKAPQLNVDTSQNTTPYVGFLATTQNNADKAGEIRKQCEGIGEGDPYLYADGKYTALRPYRYHLLAAEQFWVNRNDQGEVLSITKTNPQDWRDEHKEDVISAVLADVNGTLIPALCSFRTTKTGGVHKAIDNLNDAADDAKWSAKSADHAKTVKAVPIPFGRFTATVDMRKSTAKGSGRPLYLASCSVKLVTPAEATRLDAYLSSPEGQAAIASVMATYDAKVAELSKGVK